jgi:ABC-type multidrug transport system ATPase subunit
MSPNDCVTPVGIINRGKLAACGTFAELKNSTGEQATLEQIFLELTDAKTKLLLSLRQTDGNHHFLNIGISSATARKPAKPINRAKKITAPH